MTQGQYVSEGRYGDESRVGGSVSPAYQREGGGGVLRELEQQEKLLQILRDSAAGLEERLTHVLTPPPATVSPFEGGVGDAQLAAEACSPVLEQLRGSNRQLERLCGRLQALANRVE